MILTVCLLTLKYKADMGNLPSEALRTSLKSGLLRKGIFFHAEETFLKAAFYELTYVDVGFYHAVVSEWVNMDEIHTRTYEPHS